MNAVLQRCFHSGANSTFWFCRWMRQRLRKENVVSWQKLKYLSYPLFISILAIVAARWTTTTRQHHPKKMSNAILIWHFSSWMYSFCQTPLTTKASTHPLSRHISERMQFYTHIYIQKLKKKKKIDDLDENLYQWFMAEDSWHFGAKELCIRMCCAPTVHIIKMKNCPI